MTAALTPAERAQLALRNSSEFCRLTAEARIYKAAHVWSGSAFRSHPVGLVVGTIKLTNHWHVDNLCTIEITDGSGWDVLSICNDSFAHGDPHPSPIEGHALKVWRCGEWANAQYEQTLQPKLLEILTAAAEHIEAVLQKKNERAEAERQMQATRDAQMESVALAKAVGSAA